MGRVGFRMRAGKSGPTSACRQPFHASMCLPQTNGSLPAQSQATMVDRKQPRFPAIGFDSSRVPGRRLVKAYRFPAARPFLVELGGVQRARVTVPPAQPLSIARLLGPSRLEAMNVVTDAYPHQFRSRSYVVSNVLATRRSCDVVSLKLRASPMNVPTT